MPAPLVIGRLAWTALRLGSVAAVAFYAAWALTFPAYIRRANAHRGGMSAWMGIN